MKIAAFTPMHYGREYLEACLKAVEPFVEKWYIAYTPKPSYSHQGGIKCPESEEELRGVAEHVLGNKLEWYSGNYNGEGEHRNTKFRRQWDLCISVDADEVWHPDYVEPALKDAWDNPCRIVGLGGDCWYHFWRSFNWVNRDGFYPMRFDKRTGVKFNPQDGIIHSGRIYHMGYAQSKAITEYKISCHGHKDEIPSKWFQTKWLSYKEGVEQLHPSSKDIWIKPEPFDKETMPEVLKEHPNFNKEWIL